MQTFTNMREQEPQNYNLVKWLEIIIYGFETFARVQPNGFAKFLSFVKAFEDHYNEI